MVCSVRDCSSARYSRGLCEKHYRRLLRHGHPETLLRSSEPAPRSVEGCTKEAESRALCHGHYLRWLRKGDVEAGVPLGRRRQPTECTVQGCEGHPKARGLCKGHYHRLLRHGDVRADVPIRVVTGNGSISHGYRYVPVAPALRWLTRGDAWVPEHRLIMAQALGRPLHPDEVVHHINGTRTDNRLDNLELWSTRHPKGQRVDEKISFAVELLIRYRPDLLVKDALARLERKDPGT